MNDLPSKENSVQEMPDYKPGSSLTIHKFPHILNKSVDNSERMSCRNPSLLLGQSVKPLEDCLDILLLEKFLYKFDYVGMRKEKRRQEKAHLIVAA